MKPVSSWGRLSADQHQLVKLHDLTKIPELKYQATGLPHGNGRSYGDVCLNSGGVLWHTVGLDRFVSFDEISGRLVCEAGVLLKDIQRQMIPRGWMLPVTPGTQLVTVGGAIANNVHGKNHHKQGCFGKHILNLTLLRTSGEMIACSPHTRPEWFNATIGGLGLTGIITLVEIQLYRVPGPWLDTETLAYEDLTEFFHLANSSEDSWEHTVSWIDCSSKNGRGIFIRGNPINHHGRPNLTDRKFTVSAVPPVSLINRLTLRPATAAYYRLKKQQSGRALSHYESFFYPLDHVFKWNRLYGTHGFYQYQSVVPKREGFDATRAMLAEIARSGQGSFLSVLKTFGNQAPLGMLSFPMQGTTLALDFPNQGDRTHKLFARLDAIVREAGGRLYLAKDARMPKELFQAGYPHLQEFLPYRDPGISSGLSRRLIGS